tara:strand:+ start:578 stop:817 length:240 start_codon:yes stop_codon:yes gene_type:complete
MKKPIYRVIVDFEYKNKGVRTKNKESFIDTFAFSKDHKEIEEQVMEKIIRRTNTNKDKVIIKIKNIEIKGQHGYTSDRF